MDVENNENNSNKDDSKTKLDLGALLVEARGNLSLSVDDIANELRLSIQVIENLEQNQFEMGLPTAFVRGYIKSYATFVGLDTEPLLSHFDQDFDVVSPSLKSVQSISRFDSKRKEINSTSGVFKGLTLFIIVIFLTLASWEIWNRYQPQDQNSTLQNQIELDTDGSLSDVSDPSTEQLSVDSKSGEQSSQGQNLGEIKLEENAQQAETNASYTADQNDAVTSELGQNFELDDMSPMKPIASLDSNDKSTTDSNSQINQEQDLEFSTMVLDFSGQCWVEIIDARGEILANGIKQAGKHMPLQGVPPIKMVLGNPNVVSLTYQGEVYPIKKYKQGIKADLTLE